MHPSLNTLHLSSAELVKTPLSVSPSRHKADAHPSQHIVGKRAGLNNTDPEAERDPPPAATPLTFPRPQTYSTAVWNTESPPPKLQPLFSHILRPTDITNQHIEAVNIQIESASSVDQFLPLAPDGSSYLLALAQRDEPAVNSYAEAARTDGPAIRKRTEFSDRLAELRIDNDTGYRVINRTMKTGVKPPRLAHFRKFWEGLETMSPYWDAAIDQYYEGRPPPPASPASTDKSAKRPRLESMQASSNERSVLQTRADKNSEATSLDSIQDAASQTPLPDERSIGAKSATPEPRTCLRYKGRRTASGRDMPDQFRADTVKAFVEGVVWAFQASVAPPRQMPIVQINKLNLPVRQSAAVYRLPRERAKARAGCLTGPILTIQVRSDTDFDSQNMTDYQQKAKARLDLIRELGGLLQCAQERNREGKKEVQPGQGKWWTEKPRWGGGHGGKIDNHDGKGDTQVQDVLQMAEEMVSPNRQRDARLKKQKKTPAMLWKELKCGSKLWDSRTEYEAVGKHPTSNYDEVFMVSSLNHHISILKLTVHTAYTEYIRTEEPPKPPPQDSKWGSPLLQRTEWFDLFDVEQRVEAFQALWAIMSYLTREMPREKPIPVTGHDRKERGDSEPGTTMASMISGLFTSR